MRSTKNPKIVVVTDTIFAFMGKFFDWLDRMAEPNRENKAVIWLERISFVFLILMVLSAPHSIAATQTAWITGNFLWLIRLFFKPRPRFKLAPLDIALWGLFGWSLITSVFSYDPATSIDRLRVVSLFLIVYYVFYNVRNLRAAYFLGFALIFSCMVNVAWTPIQRLMGRGVEIHGLAAEGALAKAGFTDGDTLVKANGKKLKTPDDLIPVIEQNEITSIEYYRGDYETETKLNRSSLPLNEGVMERLGIEGWQTGRIVRASGFYSHYVTYSEALQLIASLAFGLFVAAFLRKKKDFGGAKTNDSKWPAFQLFWSPRLRVPAFTVFLFAFGSMCVVMLLTFTRASQLGLMISAFSILVASGNRKLLLATAAIALPIAIGGSIYLPQVRHVGFLDAKDESTLYRQTMWRDGYRIWTTSPRNFILGVGMDSVHKYWREWDMFDGGRLPIGHFHSTPIQLLVERGLSALLIWLALLGIYARSLWQGIAREREKARKGEGEILSSDLPVSSAWISQGILLGCLGGAIGFFTAGLVHYNLGDSVVAMIFFLVMGLGMKVIELQAEPDDRLTNDAAVAAELPMAA